MTPQQRKNFESIRDNVHSEQERNFCERCGKRLVDGSIHTCTSPVEQAQKALDRKAKNARELGLNYEPQPQWVGLTDEDIDQGLLRSDYAFKTAEAWRAGVVFAMTKLKDKNT